MRKCQQCQKSLENELLSTPVLGESYVLLPTASASQSMLLLQKLPTNAITPLEMDESGVFGDDLYASARYNLSLQQHYDQEQKRQQVQRRQELQHRQRRQQQRFKNSFAGSGKYFEDRASYPSRDEENLGTENSMVAVPTYADLSHHVQLLTTQLAHCGGLPVSTPLCKECVDGMVTMIDGQAERARYEKRCHSGFLPTTAFINIKSNVIDQIHEKIRFYESELNVLNENLQLMDNERKAISLQQKAIDNEEKALDHEEEELWKLLNESQLQESVYREIRDAGTAQIDAMEHKVKHLNILADMFVIGNDGEFGTINHFRMGQSASDTLEWNEINAAFGECALLLQTLANMVGLEFTDFKIVPLGSFSKMIRTSNLRMEYCLYVAFKTKLSELKLPVINLVTLVVFGLGAWISCLGQLMAYVQARDSSIKLPYKVAKHSIGGHSVIFLKKKQKEWTKALKYALTDLKWLLTWVSTRAYNSSTSPSTVIATSRKAALASTANSSILRNNQSVIIMEHYM